MCSPTKHQNQQLDGISALKAKLDSFRGLADVLTRLAHDIRSPLTAFQVLASAIATLPVDKRSLMTNAIQRISDISQELLEAERYMRETQIEVERLASSISSPKILCTDLGAVGGRPEQYDTEELERECLEQGVRPPLKSNCHLPLTAVENAGGTSEPWKK